MTLNLSNNSFQKSYLNGCINLIKTLTIKSEITADLINVSLKEKDPNFEIPSDKSRWKYYLNICGEYHYTDPPMYVTSLDTLETIVFNKENLFTHTATKAAYLYGSRYYYMLVDKYPELEQLILGILNPADMQEAIAAENGTILSLDSRYVEPQEMTLIPELESYIKRHNIRWSVPSYRTSDSYYPVAEHIVMCFNLVPILLNLRLQRCRTEEAHSFHIRQFLASHFDLNKHYRFLSERQRLWLYRNIERASKYFGRNEQFLELVEEVLSDRGVPLAGYTVRHLDELDEDNRSIAIGKAEQINDVGNTAETDYKELPYIYQEQLDLVPGNSRELSEKGDEISLSFKNHESNVIQTKYLESSMVDYSNAAPDKFNEVILREFIHLVYRDKYLAYCEYKDIRTGEYITISVKDALIYLLYLTYNLVGLKLKYVPLVWSGRFTLSPFPSIEEIMSVADDSYASKRKLAEYLYGNAPIDQPVMSVTGFYDRAYKVYLETTKQWKIISNTEDMYDRAEAQKMCDRIYGYGDFRIVPEETTFDEWRNRLNIQEYDYSVEECQEMITSIFTSATGLNLDNSTSVPHIQKSLVDLMRKLTSYSLQYVTDVNEDPIVMLNKVATRHNHPAVSGFSSYTEDPLVDVLDDPGRVKETYDMTTQTKMSLEVGQYLITSPSEFDVVLKTDVTSTPRFSYSVNIDSPLTVAKDRQSAEPNPQHPFLGYELYTQMTQEQIKSVPN